MLLLGGLTGATLIGGYALYRSRMTKAQNVRRHYLYPYVKAALTWNHVEFDDFIRHLKVAEQDLILSSLGFDTNSQAYNPDTIKRTVRYNASNIATYPFREKLDYNYHEEIVAWTADHYGIPQSTTKESSTFEVEHLIMKQVFMELWDSMNPTQRQEILTKIDDGNHIKDKAGLALAGGATALAVLSGTVHFLGFTFYLTMSSIIYTTAGVFGTTVPFAAYAASSSTIAALSGPIGWAIFGIASTGAVLFLGRADRLKSTAFIIQMHMIKVASLEQSGELEKTMRFLKL